MQDAGIYWEGICGKSISIEPTSGVTVKADPGTDTVEPSIPDAAAALAAETTTTAKSPASTTNTVKKDPPKATASTKPSTYQDVLGVLTLSGCGKPIETG
ncbi:MAG: hypothetical protein Q9223_000737 [Gallowayella weberi]